MVLGSALRVRSVPEFQDSRENKSKLEEIVRSWCLVRLWRCGAAVRIEDPGQGARQRLEAWRAEARRRRPEVRRWKSEAMGFSPRALAQGLQPIRPWALAHRL